MMISASGKCSYTEDDAVQPQIGNICYFDRWRFAGVYSLAALRQTLFSSKVGIQYLSNKHT